MTPRRDREEGDENSRWISKEKQDVLIVALVLVLAALILFWRAAVTEDEYWRAVFFALAHASVVVGAFSLLLELPHITNFIVREIGKLMYGREYLERNKSLIPGIRRTADLIFYGKPALEYPGSLYNFIDKNIHRYYISHYRRQYQEVVELKFAPSGLLIFESRTKYILVLNRSSNVPLEPIEIPYFSSVTIDDTIRELKDHLLSLELIVGANRFLLDVNKTSLERRGSVTGEPVAIPLTIETVGDRIDYSFTYTPPDALFSELGELPIEIYERTQLRYKNDVYAIRMGLPTQNFVIICNAPEGVRLIPTSFDIDPQEESTEAIGHVVLPINEWLLPGHGVALGWDLPPRELVARVERVEARSDQADKAG